MSEKNNNFVFIILGIIPLLIIGYFVYTHLNNTEQNTKQVSSTPTPAKTIAKKTTPKIEKYDVPKNLDEAMKIFTEAKNLTMFPAIKEYGKNISQQELAIIKNKLKPIPKGMQIDAKELEYRKNMIRMLSQFPRKNVFDILEPLTRAENLNIERCNAIVAIGDIGDEECFDFLANGIDFTNYNSDIAIAVMMGMERNGSSKIIDYFINMLKNADNDPKSKHYNVYLTISERLYTITNHRIMFNPATDTFQDLANRWSEWRRENPDFVTMRQRGRDKFFW